MLKGWVSLSDINKFGEIIGLKPSINPLNNPSPGAAFSPTSEASGTTMHSNNPVYGGEDEANQYPFAGTWNKVRGFLEENIQLFQEKFIKNIIN